MSGPEQNGGGTEFDEFADLLDELDNWDKTFEALTEAGTEPGLGVAPEASGEDAAADDADDDLEVEISVSHPEPAHREEDDPDDGGIEIEFDVEPTALAPMLGEPGSGVRRSPALVRREDLERRRREREASEPAIEIAGGPSPDYELDLDDDAADDWDAAPVTSVMAKSTVDKMVETAAAFFEEDDGGNEVELELDGDFYDDIEIDRAAEPEPGAVQEPVIDTEGSRGTRRTMAHVVRRAPSVVEDVPAPLQHGDDEVVVEIEADHEDLELLAGGGPGFDDALLSEALSESPEGGGVFGPDVDLPSEAARALAGRQKLPHGRIDSIEKLREALAIGPAPVAGELDTEIPAEGARALADGELASISLPEVELPPELPPRVLPAAVPGLDAVELALPERVEGEPDDRTDARVLRLEQAREAIEQRAAGPERGRLHVWAAELAGDLGDLDELERHATEAATDDPDLGGYVAALQRQRFARLGDWDAAAAALGERAGDDSVEGAALAELGSELSAALGHGATGDGGSDDVDHRWRALVAAVTGAGDTDIDELAPALAEAVADEPMRAALMHLWLRRRGHEAWPRASAIAPSIGGDLIAWELAATRGPSARATAARQIADGLDQRSLAPSLVDSLRIVAGEALVATGESGEARELFDAVAERQVAHPVLGRLMLGVLGPEDRETTGYLLAALSGTALAPEAARALRRWAESDTGAARAERLRRAQALSPGDPLIRADVEAAEREADAASSSVALEVSVGLALAPQVSGDPAALLDRARERASAGDAEAALSELAAPELPRGELLVAAEIVDAAERVGPDAVTRVWQSLAGDLGETGRALLGRRALLSEIDRAIAERDLETGVDLGEALSGLAAMASADRIAARAALAEALDSGPPALAPVLEAAGDWPGLDAAGCALEQLALGIEGSELSETAADQALAAVDELDDPRTEWLAIAALGRSGDWERAADRLAAAETVEASYRSAYLLLEQVDDAAAADARLTEIADAHPELAPVSDLLDAARRKLGVAAEIARPTRARRRTSDPWTATINGAELAARVGDLGKAIDIYKRALTERPDDPIAVEGLEWTARAALDAAPLAERALARLRSAEDSGDIVARAEAYATLARIDGEIRGDPASALLAWESCADLDPSQTEALRALERAYLAEARHRELLVLYGRLLAGADSDREIAALLSLRARSSERLGRDHAEVLSDYRQIVALDDAVDRLALFHLEASAHHEPPSLDRAELEGRVARLLESDPRSAAAFLCRSAETIDSLGDHAGAAARFIEALETRAGHVPSLRGWRRAAVAAGDFRAVAEAAEAEAASTADPEARLELFHLAGVVWMDKVTDGDQARRALSAVLALEPHHEDAFARMRLLYDEVGDDEGLGDLLRQLLDSSPPDDIALAAHLELATLCRNFWEDREGAIAHMKAVLELAPANKKAIAELSDIYWELGRWDDAADALIRRARLESDPGVLKHIFYRLGTIYADHLPESKWALRCFRKVLGYDPADVPTLDRMALLAADSGDYKMALGAYEKLLKLDLEPDDKVRYLHRVADLQENAMGQPASAERALRLAFDLAPQSQAALRRLVDFYTRAGDMTSIRVNLDRAAQAMRARIVESPVDPTPYAVIARVLETRQEAGVPGSLAVAQAAAELARALGDESRATADIAATRPGTRPRLEALATPESDELLIPRVVPAGLRVLFSALRGRLPKYVGADVKRFGVGRSDRLRKGKHPVANFANEIAGELGLRNVEVYVSSAVTDRAMVIPSSPPAVILGSRFASLDRSAELAFALGRCLKLAQMGLAMVDTMSPAELDKLVGGMVRQFAPDFAVFNLDDAVLSAEQHRLRRLVPGGLANELRPHALALTGVLLEPESLHAALRLCGLRAGLVASGNAAAALAAGVRHSGYSTSRQAAGNPDIQGLLRFAVSEEHVDIQALLAAR